MDNLHRKNLIIEMNTRYKILPSGKFMINLNKPPSHGVYERKSSAIELVAIFDL